jgi:phospholipid transport system substrate-binding protein
MVMRISRILLIFMVLVVGAGPLRAAPQDAAGFIDSLVGQALDTLRDKSLAEAARVQRFDALLQRDFDLPRIARYVLGRYWSQATAADRGAFAELFERWAVRTYASRLSQYKGETVKVTGARTEGDGGAVVATEVGRPGGGPPIKLEWRVEDSDGTFKILDVTVAGISMALTEREEIAAAIQRSGGTVAMLNRDLAARLNGTTTSASR